MKVIFNNNADMAWYQWSGSREGLEKWLATAEGFTKMVKLRRESPVVVLVKQEHVYVDIWNDQPGVEFVPHNISDFLS